MSTSAGHVRNQRGRFRESSPFCQVFAEHALKAAEAQLAVVKQINEEYDRRRHYAERSLLKLEAATIIGGLCLQYIPKAQAVFITPSRQHPGGYAFRVHSTASRVGVQSGVRRMRMALNWLGSMAGRDPLCTIISR